VCFSDHFTPIWQNKMARVAYNVNRKDSHTVLTELITIHPKGAFGLFYTTLTGRAMPSQELNVKVDDVLSRVAGIGHEYMLATASRPTCVGCNFNSNMPRLRRLLVRLCLVCRRPWRLSFRSLKWLVCEAFKTRPDLAPNV